MEDAGALTITRADREIHPDDDLALAARSDPDAFGLLYERHKLAVYRYLRARTRTDDDAGELTAIVFERALNAIPRYRPRGGGFVAWLIRIARNAAVDSHRRASAEPLAFDVSDPGCVRGPEDAVLADEARSALLQSVAGLPPAQREVVVLRYAAGLTAREIGVVIGRSDQAAQKLLSRALATIRETYRVDV